MGKIVADFGAWDSPITGQQLIGGNCKMINELRVSPRGHPFWLEQTAIGKKVLFSQDGDEIVQWTQPDISVTNSVHEYGGASLCVQWHNANGGGLLVCHSGGIWLLSAPCAVPKPIIQSETPDGDGTLLRHADIAAHGDFVYAVQEIHSKKDESAEPTNKLVRVNVRDEHSEVVSEGADFYASPRVSPNGRWLVWIQWNRPYMSWERTSVHLVELADDGTLRGPSRTILDNGRSNFGLASTETALWTLSDVGGEWNIFRLDHSESAKGLLGDGLIPKGHGEIGDPLWLFDMDRPFVLRTDGSAIAVLRSPGRSLGGDALWQLRDGVPPTPFASPTELGFTVFKQLCLSPDQRALYCLASGPRRASSMIRLDLSTDCPTVAVIREARAHSELSQLPLSVPSLITFTDNGHSLEGYFYAPHSHTYCAPEGKLPPVVLFVHGGPTACTKNDLDMKIQYFTSRGFAAFDINYRGSAGFGREFRDSLLGQWGVADRDDLIGGAKFLISSGLVDPSRVFIMGSSAGGFTVLSVLAHSDVFAAGVSLYGVSDLEQLAMASHKFERDNTMRLIAQLPDGIQTYRDRSPIHNCNRINKPVAFLHGTEDKVVPKEQSEVMHEMLRAKGTPTLLKLFPGEGHGFKKADTIAQSLQIAHSFFCQTMVS
ncbi:hypothetical protein niasHS_006602 [Heterodera schachtii]|uniref:Peptidase S9 prolyl oligopeptidase catalytic domain-containing protein n=1 Tax=Heterodera schachtii TaxID=97005 RepID=A0ABD2JHQ0_HETSC